MTMFQITRNTPSIKVAIVKALKQIGKEPTARNVARVYHSYMDTDGDLELNVSDALASVFGGDHEDYNVSL